MRLLKLNLSESEIERLHDEGYAHPNYKVQKRIYQSEGFGVLWSNRYGSNQNELECHSDNILQSFHILPI